MLLGCRYKAIKNECYTRFGVNNQVLLTKTLRMRNADSILQNITVQMNAKLGGKAWGVKAGFVSAKVSFLIFSSHLLIWYAKAKLQLHLKKTKICNFVKLQFDFTMWFVWHSDRLSDSDRQMTVDCTFFSTPTLSHKTLITQNCKMQVLNDFPYFSRRKTACWSVSTPSMTLTCGPHPWQFLWPPQTKRWLTTSPSAKSRTYTQSSSMDSKSAWWRHWQGIREFLNGKHAECS